MSSNFSTTAGVEHSKHIVPGLDHVAVPQSDVEVFDYYTKYP